MVSPFSFGALTLPTIFIALSLAGSLIALVWRRVGVALALVSSLFLYAAATPALSSYLLRQVESELPQNVDLAGAQAIVVLSGDVQSGDGAAVPDRLGLLSLERVVFAAQAQRRLRLPMLISGGRGRSAHTSMAALMKAALEEDFSVPVRWSEDGSHTTWENALFTARLLAREKLSTVVLVSQAWHLPRALWAFQRAGLTPLPWPVPRTEPTRYRIGSFLPSIGALLDTFYALHEMMGGAYYRLRY